MLNKWIGRGFNFEFSYTLRWRNPLRIVFLAFLQYPWDRVASSKYTYFFWNMTIGSFSKSDISTEAPFSKTSLCFRTMSQPMWEKKKPRLALWGSASVSVNLWWTLCKELLLISTVNGFRSSFYVLLLNIMLTHVLRLVWQVNWS